MTHTELIHQIRDIIRGITKCEYTRPIIVKNLKPQGYQVGFETHQYAPVWYSAELPDDKFLKFICGELKRAQFLRAQYGKATRNTSNGHHNDFISPYDTARIDTKNR